MINVLYDAKDFVICKKPSGFISEYKENSSVSLPTALATQLGTKELFTVHRLDKEVGGVMVYAKTSQFAAHLSSQINSGDFKKEYMAKISGRPPEDEARLCDLLFHDRQKNKTYVVKRKRAGVKEAILEYKLLSYDDLADVSTLKIELFTGRTHQIRVQFASRGYPICGDRKYGSPVSLNPMQLHSHKLSFKDMDGKVLSFSSEPQW